MISKPPAKVTATCFKIIPQADYTENRATKRGGTHSVLELSFLDITLDKALSYVEHIPGLKILPKSSFCIIIYQIVLGKLTNQINYI